MTCRRGAGLADYYADPDRAAERKHRAAESMAKHRAELTRASKAALRGCDVPPELEDTWKALKRGKRMASKEVAKALGLRWTPPRRRKKGAKRPAKGE
ncbi:hypothetical protein [Microcystis phage Mae-JY30]